jgi:predicted DCC family thiol-disulfide oxidoreductase YuxK
MAPVTSLTVLYDPGCGLCTWAKDWILRQPSLVRLRFVAAGSSEARAAYPQLPPGELAVVADTGEVWLGNRAWIVCLWALRAYRDLAFRLTSPGLLRFAQEAFSAVSRNRLALARLLKLRSERELEEVLRKEPRPACQITRE